MQILVAGANGFIGINQTLYLLEKGHDVIMTCRNGLTEENQKLVAPYGDRVVCVPGDLLDEALYKELDRYEPDGIVNAAIYTSTSENELDYFIPVCRVNMSSNINLMEYAIRHRVKHYVYVSSSGVYGSASDIGDIVTEESEPDLPDAYDRTKLASEMLVTRMGELTGMSAVSARIAAPYGPFERVTGSRVFMSPPYTMVHLAREGKTARICGGAYQRDWTYVRDTVDGIYRLLVSDTLKYSVYNVSSSRNASLVEMAEALRRVCPSFCYELVDSPEEGNLVADMTDMRGALSVERLAGDTGYQAKYDIYRGMEAYYNSFSRV